jgi:hypothetical protein
MKLGIWVLPTMIPTFFGMIHLPITVPDFPDEKP